MRFCSHFAGVEFISRKMLSKKSHALRNSYFRGVTFAYAGFS
jgi:hypothetical protein